jgi:hypothetical protein
MLGVTLARLEVTDVVSSGADPIRELTMRPAVDSSRRNKCR